MELNLKQRELAALVGVAQSTVEWWESSPQGRASKGKLVLLAVALRVRTDMLADALPVLVRRKRIRVVRAPRTEFGKLIRARRIALGVQQKEIASALRVSLGTVIRWEIYGGIPWRERFWEVAERLAPILLVEEGRILAALAASVSEPIWEPRHDLGRFIRTRRKELGYTLATLAQELGKPVHYVNEVEHYHASLGSASIEAWAKCLRCSKGDLLLCFKNYKEHEPGTELGRFIRRKRKEVGLSLSELANLVGVTPARIGGMELHHFLLSKADIAARLAAALRVDVAELEQRRPKVDLRGRPRKRLY